MMFMYCPKIDVVIDVKLNVEFTLQTMYCKFGDTELVCITYYAEKFYTYI